MLELVTDPASWVSLATLAALEIVLGIDNIVFITILTSRLPPARQARARQTGLVLALGLRLGLLFALTWIMSLTTPLFSLLGQGFSGRHLILLGGGLFLMGKATLEMYHQLEVAHPDADTQGSGRSFAWTLLQILLLDLVFSLDSVITAVGMAQHLAIMAAAMVIAVGVMLLFAGAIGEFVLRHPSIKVLALAFLLMIGVLLSAEAFEHHIPKGYVYFAMAFSLAVELLNMRLRKKSQAPVKLHARYEAPQARAP